MAARGTGATRRAFEADFLRYCAESGFSPGYECAKMMDSAARTRDVRTFAALALIWDRVAGNEGENTGQTSLFVIDRRRDPQIEKAAGIIAAERVALEQEQQQEAARVIAASIERAEREPELHQDELEAFGSSEIFPPDSEPVDLFASEYYE